MVNEHLSLFERLVAGEPPAGVPDTVKLHQNL
jgi:hypothetical protein